MYKYNRVEAIVITLDHKLSFLFAHVSGEEIWREKSELLPFSKKSFKIKKQIMSSLVKKLKRINKKKKSCLGYEPKLLWTLDERHSINIDDIEKTLILIF